jgi:hypothetical protein
MGWFNKLTGAISGAPIPLPMKLAALAVEYGARVGLDAIQGRPLTGRRLASLGVDTLKSTALKSLFGMGKGGIPNPALLKPKIPSRPPIQPTPLPMPGPSPMPGQWPGEPKYYLYKK